MVSKERLIMSQKELKRAKILEEIVKKRLKQVEAAKILSLSERQINRLMKRYKQGGAEAIIHQSRGCKSPRALSEGLRAKIVRIYEKKYSDFGPKLASEKLEELHKVKISDESLRQLLMSKGLWSKRRKSRKHRRHRERKHYQGQMLQLDGSIHFWLEDRAGDFVLMAFIDDATGEVYAKFYAYEGTFPAMDLTMDYILEKGVPQSIYADRHTTYKSPKEASIEEQLKGQKFAYSQYERACRELGMDLIHAYSPQAKGRVERLFKTLQDRLVKEMRLKKIKTMQDANTFLKAYLPEFNKRFSIDPVNPLNLHTKRPHIRCLKQAMSIKTERTLKNDNTISFNKQLYQIIRPVQAKKLIVEQRLDGSIILSAKGKLVSYKLIEKPQPKLKSVNILKMPKKIYHPPQKHPWRRSFKASKEEKELLTGT